MRLAFLHLRRRVTLCSLSVLLPLGAAGQEACPKGIAVNGQVVDSTGAAIVGAVVTLDRLPPERSNQRGEFTYDCVSAQTHTLQVSADGFAERSLSISPSRAGHAAAKPS